MQNEKTQLGEITLVGLTARTNNKNEINPETSQIGALAGEFFGKQLANHIQHRFNPGVTYAMYTEFESDENGEYTYFIGEAVESFEDQDLSQFKTLIIPASKYQKFTTAEGAMPDVVVSAWQELWAMSEDDVGGKRKYIADFEIYDQRASDPNNTVIDIYIGIN